MKGKKLRYLALLVGLVLCLALIYHVATLVIRHSTSTDPEVARKAIETVKNLDQKKLIDADEVEKLKAEVQKAMAAKLEEKDKLLAAKDAVLQRELIGGRFARSSYIKEKLISPTVGGEPQGFSGRELNTELNLCALEISPNK